MICLAERSGLPWSGNDKNTCADDLATSFWRLTFKDAMTAPLEPASAYRCIDARDTGNPQADCARKYL